MPFVPILALLALIKKLGDFFKQITNKDVNGAVTQAFMWIVSVLVVWGVAQTGHFADGITVGDTILSKLNFAALVFVGLSIGSGAGLVHDTLQARDNTNEAAVTKLKLLPGVRSAKAKHAA